jgi:regulator of protease activity HflC (stomatin/prohibitin superfamily)
MSNSELPVPFLFSTAAASGTGASRRTLLPLKLPPTGRSGLPSSQPEAGPKLYRGVLLVLLLAVLVGVAGVLVASGIIADLVLLDTALMLLLASGVLIGVIAALTARAKPPQTDDGDPSRWCEEQSDTASSGPTLPAASQVINRLARARARIGDQLQHLSAIDSIRVGTAVAGVLGILFVLLLRPTVTAASGLAFTIVAALCLVAAGLAMTAARYFGAIEPDRFPESLPLCRGARVIAWVFVAAALSMALAWAGQQTIVRVLHFAIVAVAAAVCYGLFTIRNPAPEQVETFPLDLPALWVLGNRTNILASILDAAEQQLGIDLRSTWALTVVRSAIEPLAIALAFAGWLSTSLTVVGLEEQGLVERFGVPLAGQPLASGLHVHWPFPIDRVYRLPVQRVQTISVGHEGEEGNGPEDVLWARQHAANEYTLLLGNGRDLITVDAAVQYRIADPRAWRYHSQNPADALRAIAYRAVMRNTVNRTLDEALSENVAALAGRMRQMVQREADALGLGVEVVAFTFGGMHPPVMVASEYQSVVSAEIAKVTAVVNAQAFRNETVPSAEASVLTGENAAQADGAQDLARAAGEAWSFRTLESQFRTNPQEYLFRRRLEAMEKNLAGRKFTVVDSRFLRDGGELWLTP